MHVRLTGEPVMLEDELKSVEESIGIANLLSLAIVVVLLIVGLAFRAAWSRRPRSR